MNKKLMREILAVCMSVSLVGCSKNNEVVEPAKSSLAVDIVESEVDLVAKEGFENVYSYTSTEAIDYSNIVYPNFYVYAGVKSETEAEALVKEMGLKSVADAWAGSINVVSPLNGKSYTEKDADQFLDVLGFAISNAKVIGIDEGATFVNELLRDNLYAVAGVMTYGGEMSQAADKGIEVPAYLANPAENAKNYFIAVNNAVETEKNTYVNPDNALEKVVVGDDETIMDAFKNAWTTVFSKNYRQHNSSTEFYNISARDVKTDYELNAIADYEALGIKYEPHYNEALNGEGKYTWFEYIPEKTLEEKEGTVPLVVTLHGNGNDARIQGESVGWPELASTEGFMVVAPEWQEYVVQGGSTEQNPNFFGCDGLQNDKLIEWIEMLKVKYPQIDASRIYVTGLSAGASASTLYGVKYSNVFAAVGAVSGPGVDKEELAKIVKTYGGGEVPYLYICGDHDFFGMLPVDGSSTFSMPIDPEHGVYIQHVDPNVSMFEFIQAYQKVNGLPVSKKYDLSLNEYYGVALDNQTWTKLGDKDMLEGTLSNDNGVIMKLAAVKNQAHWNNKNEAKYIYDFFKQYSRNDDGSLNRQ
ncbi:MAG: poly(3-hydroxybutyrate) depolymerase [Firmicutes bacterium]|nr:poly(3-hydroxybutyrate) depolymerase [Bacillota bacterium]